VITIGESGGIWKEVVVVRICLEELTSNKNDLKFDVAISERKKY
jgi:hypothetical protein